MLNAALLITALEEFLSTLKFYPLIASLRLLKSKQLFNTSLTLICKNLRSTYTR
jgi:hypothetical protein